MEIPEPELEKQFLEPDRKQMSEHYSEIMMFCLLSELEMRKAKDWNKYKPEIEKYSLMSIDEIGTEFLYCMIKYEILEEALDKKFKSGITKDEEVALSDKGRFLK